MHRLPHLFGHLQERWTSRDGVEYAWFNNVETKPGIGYPKEWENQEKWKGGWVRKPNGKLEPRQGGRLKILGNIFANPNMPAIDDYYEPFTYDYEHLQNAPEMQTPPTARPVSVLTGKKMDKIEWGPNWEDDLGGEFSKRSKDALFEGIQKEMYSAFENTFMMYLPRLCEHCLNPACVASCPSGSIYKREDDGIVLIDQDKCRGWRMCVSGCPYKKIYYNCTSGKAEKCTFCYPRIEGGQPTVCSETCVGRIRYLGVLLYDADKIDEAAAVEDPKSLYEAQLGVFLDPNAPEVIAEAQKQGIPQSWIDAAQRSPVYKMAMEWKVAFRCTRNTGPADGVVHPAAVADPVRDGKRPDRRERHHSGRQGFAHPHPVPGQSVDRGQGRAGGEGAGNHGRDAALYAQEERGEGVGRRHSQGHASEPGPGGRDVPGDGHRQLRRPLRDSVQPQGIGGKHLRGQGVLRLHLRQRLLRRRVRGQPVRQEEGDPIVFHDMRRDRKSNSGQ